ncbi:uncharacterized protein LAESUDRAFT_651676 [Laetiporus sulphureus 93-53]|uniref:DUF7330 domain-containing protein n=1 Tax=Laetiporus sulphureus 93-53 TaxID=1314785 RepID=A0A165EKF3_9APHY|nr:uncharacterized protein LAESUDRAFT_651676 [Laetiporus sulphureus 93-53]KZT07243.1 hypothetical protein LAESUDRAFT_651676 [Laetiporus sulphureus 93-53]
MLTVVQRVDAPPPYDGTRAESSGAPSAAAPSPPPLSPPPRPLPVFRPTTKQCVNYLSLFSRNDAISGTYLVDPLLSASPFEGIFACRDKRKAHKRDRSIERDHARHLRDAFGTIPNVDEKDPARRCEVNAALRSRNGAINIDLAIADSGTGRIVNGQETTVCGRVMLSSRHGRINVNLFEVQLGRAVDLDVSTRSGSITVFLPPTFNGAIALHTRNGSRGVHFLPAFAERACVVRSSERDLLVAVSSPERPANPPSQYGAPSAGTDYCVIRTRHGKITIGLSGVDIAPVLMRTGGLMGQFEALVEAGHKQLETMIEAGTKAIETALIGRLEAGGVASARPAPYAPRGGL